MLKLSLSNFSLTSFNHLISSKSLMTPKPTVFSFSPRPYIRHKQITLYDPIITMLRGVDLLFKHESMPYNITQITLFVCFNPSAKMFFNAK